MGFRGEPFRGSFFKGAAQVPAKGEKAAAPASSVKVARVTRKRQAKAVENKTMQGARRRDRRCRFPGCECDKFKLVLEVAHLQHRGSGGNPKGDRTKQEKLILFCVARHRINAVSLDRGTVRVRPLTKQGTDGACAFDIDRGAARIGPIDGQRGKWFELATELRPGVLVPLSAAQLEVMQLIKVQL